MIEATDITINVNEKEIKGQLTGSQKHWTFKSSDDHFLQFYPNGNVSNAMIYTEIPKPEQRIIFDAISDEIEKLSEN